MVEENPLARWLRQASCSQSRLATESGVPQPEISKFALGKRRPGVPKAKRIADATARLSPRGVRPVRIDDFALIVPSPSRNAGSTSEPEAA